MQEQVSALDAEREKQEERANRAREEADNAENKLAHLREELEMAEEKLRDLHAMQQAAAGARDGKANQKYNAVVWAFFRSIGPERAPMLNMAQKTRIRRQHQLP